MSRYSGGYWSSMASKPKGFKQVPKKPQVYTYTIEVICDRLEIDNIIIECKITYDHIRGKVIDDVYLKNYLLDTYSISNYNRTDSFFSRDGDGFPIVSRISVINKEEYFKAKKKKDRFNKLTYLLEDEKTD